MATRVLLIAGAVQRRNGTMSFKAQWYSSPGGTPMYSSKLCDSKDGAKALAYKWLAKQEPGQYEDVFAVK